MCLYNIPTCTSHAHWFYKLDWIHKIFGFKESQILQFSFKFKRLSLTAELEDNLRTGGGLYDGSLFNSIRTATEGRRMSSADSISRPKIRVGTHWICLDDGQAAHEVWKVNTPLCCYLINSIDMRVRHTYKAEQLTE
jgi:hypothetical protein